MSYLDNLIADAVGSSDVEDSDVTDRPIFYNPEKLTIFFGDGVEQKLDALQDPLMLSSQAENLIEANEPTDSTLLTTMVESRQSRTSEEVDVVPYLSRSTSNASLGNIEGLKAVNTGFISPEDDQMLTSLGLVLEEAILNTTEVSNAIDRSSLENIGIFVDQLRGRLDTLITETYGVVDVNTTAIETVILAYREVGIETQALEHILEVGTTVLNLKEFSVMDMLNYLQILYSDFLEDSSWLMSTCTELGSKAGGEALTTLFKLRFLKERHEVNRVGKVVLTMKQIAESDVLNLIKSEFVTQ